MNYELELYVMEGDENVFEGVFTSLKEIADYLGIPKRIVTELLAAEYESLDKKYHKYSIIRAYSKEDFQNDLTDNTTLQ